nr:hypothetical protein [Tanacetum cinerariifolium]
MSNNARKLFDEMRAQGHMLDLSTYRDILMIFYSKHRLDLELSLKFDIAWDLLNELCEKGVKHDNHTYIAFSTEDARKVFDEMRAQGHMLDLSTYRVILMILYSKHRLDLALSLVRLVGDNELNADISVYNALIDGAIRCRKFDIASDLFNELCEKGVKHDNHTYIALIQAFSIEGILDKAKNLFSEMKESGYKPNSYIFNNLLQGHLLKKRYDDVEILLHKMAET